MSGSYRPTNARIITADGRMPEIGETVIIRFDDWFEGIHEVSGQLEARGADGARIRIRGGLAIVVPPGAEVVKS